MQLAPEAFDPATVAFMGRVCDCVWDEARTGCRFSQPKILLACAMSSPCASWPPLRMASEIRIGSG